MDHLLPLSAIILCCTLVASAPAELTVTTSRAIPVVGGQVAVGARWTGEIPDDPSPVRLTLIRDGSAVTQHSVQMEPQDDGTLLGEVTWTPNDDGLYLVRAEALIGGRSHDAERTLPVTRHRLHFVWYGSGPELRWATAITPPAREEQMQRWWRDRGVQQLDWKGVSVPEDRDMAENWLAFGDADGIAIDEIGMYDRLPSAEERAQRAFDALAGFDEAAPDAFLAVWNAGSLTAAAANAYRAHADLVMLEAYRQYVRGAFNTRTFYDYIDQRVQMARRMDVLEKCVIGLGITNAYGGVTVAEIRRSVEHIRLTAPETPGLAWFRHAGPERVEPEVLRAADEMALEYFIRPCLMVREWDLQHVPGTPARLSVNVHNIGGMDARDVAVAFYDGHPENGGRQIGRVEIPVAHAARGWSEEYEDLPAAQARSLAFGVTETSVEWTPPGRVAEIWVRIWSPDATLLSDLAHRRMWTPAG